MDFIVDGLATGRMVRILNVVDAYTRECLALEADTSLGKRPGKAGAGAGDSRARGKHFQGALLLDPGAGDRTGTRTTRADTLRE